LKIKTIRGGGGGGGGLERIISDGLDGELLSKKKQFGVNKKEQFCDMSLGKK